MTAYLNAKTKLYFSFLFLIFLWLAACKKDVVQSPVGANFIGVRNGFHLFDSSVDVKAYSVLMDSLVTHNMFYYPIGASQDPFLGYSQANMALQASLPVDGFSWSGAASLDS